MTIIALFGLVCAYSWILARIADKPGCIANPRIVDALLEYALNEVENYQGEIK